MSLKEELKDIAGRKRRFMLLRIADVEAEQARAMCEVPKGTYNSWLSDPTCSFVQLYRRRDEFSAEYKQEAIQLLRRDNQLAAVMLEEKIILKMKEEIETGSYNLIRTNLARDVYTKLIGDLDFQPQVTALTWVDRLQQLTITPPGGGNAHQVIEATASINPEHQES